MSLKINMSITHGKKRYAQHYIRLDISKKKSLFKKALPTIFVQYEKSEDYHLLDI